MNIDKIKTYTISNLPTILRDMATYIEEDCEFDQKENKYGDDVVNYFKEITSSGLFNDAMGKPIIKSDTTISVTTEY